MEQAHNDNDEQTFKKIGLAADLVLTMLRLQARVSDGQHDLTAEQKFGDAIREVENGYGSNDAEKEDGRQTKIAIK